MAAPPTADQIRRAVTESVSILMQRSGHAGQVSSDADVIRGLGLTSEDGVELACMLESALNIHIPHDANPLIDESTGRKQPRTVSQVCTAVAGWAGNGGAG